VNSARSLPVAFLDTKDNEFRIRELASGDRETLERFYAGFEPKRAAQGLPPEGAHRIERWLDTVLSGGTHLAVEAGGQVVGHAFLVPTERPGVAEYAIFLDREVRGRGVGTRVNQIAARVARERGLRQLWLSVEPRNRAAVRSYQKAGFRFLRGTIFSLEAEMEMELEGE
jgi:ribosomal protein S18 acetylase RimI-like enzyme